MDESNAPPIPDPPPTGTEARVEPAPDHAEEDLADVVDDAVPARSLGMLPIVGLGGSAGSLAALVAFFAAVPAASGMAYVVVVHLAPDHVSVLAEILQRVTPMPVRQVDDSARVEADHVYVIAPGKTLTAANGHLICGDLTPERGRRFAVDLFFRTLADTHGARAVAVVLSGADSDGTVGIRRIKERGGLAIAQDPAEAEHGGMPRSAIATGEIDWILRAAEMPGRIGSFADVVARLEMPANEKAVVVGGARPVDGREAAYDMVLKYVRTHTGRDFSNYKRPTVLRRIARRMGVCGVTEMADYLAFMRIHPAECAALLRDLLISVTNFFRDRDAFDALELQIPALFEGKKASAEVRVWVPACATGEEAYSIAMLLCEHARSLDAPPKFQVFATDLDDAAIRAAREAIYSPAIAEEAFRRQAADGTPFEVEKRYVRSDGSFVWVSASVTAVLDAAQRPASAIAIVLDVGERRQAQQALGESEERLRLIVDNAREYAIFSMDLKRRITSWNSGAESLTGYTADEAIGESGDIIFTEEDCAAHVPQREARQALEEGRAADERWHRRTNGVRFWASGVMMAMRDGEGAHPIGLLKVFRDQTQARAAEQALETSRAELVQALVDNRKARAEAKAASHAKDRFLAILSHELRTPLTPVVMALHSLERNAELPASLRGTVELIRRNVRAELMLIDDLLDVTRISSGKFEMTRAQTDMHEVVHAAADVCAADFTAKRQRIGLALHAMRHVVPGDAARLQQVVWNLLKNASKFTPNEGEIKVVSSNVDNRFVLIVADTGIGIASDALPAIFDAFAQEGPWVTSEFGGLGLGLAIAKATIEAHHGSLVAASGGRNQGATFTIELPLG